MTPQRHKGEFLKLDQRNSILHRVRCGGCQELALRYCNCHFECIFCFAISYAWPSRWKNAAQIRRCGPEEIADSIKREIRAEEFDWIRISGGEPLLNEERTRETVSALQLVDKSIKDPLRVVLQTNGFTLQSAGIQNELANLTRTKNLRILIELSFKGTNSEEFSLLTQKRPDLYLRQIGAYDTLQDLASELKTSVRARMGIGPHPKSIMFVYPDTFPEQNGDQSIEPMFHPSKWSKSFRGVYERELRKHGYFAIENINVTEGGINARTQLNIPAIARLLERRLVVDRANIINTYRDFSRISKARFPLLDLSQTERLEKQYQEIKSRFGIVPAATYLGMSEFPP